MIRTTIELGNDHILKDIRLEGHAQMDLPGKDLICTAVSILVQSAYLTFSSIPEVEVEVNNQKDFYFQLKKSNKLYSGELRGITFYLINSLSALEKKYGKYLKLEIKGDQHGTS